MRVAYFDAVGGAAGDMILGALIDAGVPLDSLRTEIDKLGLPDVTIRVDRVIKRGISAAQFEVVVAGLEEHHHHHDHADAGRSLREITHLIEGSAISEPAKVTAVRVYRLLGEAEGKVHGVAPEQVHFHEIGALDSIVDVVGCAVALELLHLDAVYCSPLPTGSGFVQTQHGRYPIPAPATLEILSMARVPTRASRVDAEQVTPTGAALLASVAEFSQPGMTPEAIGYGAGHAELSVPNVLRVWVGDASPMGIESLVVLQTNIDDMSPELSAHVLERCLQEGALDALLVPVIMKKGRPGVQLEVLCRPDRLDGLRSLILAETTTLGVRWWTVDRQALLREEQAVQTRYGSVKVKVGTLGNGERRVSPEYEDCRRLATEVGVPLAHVYRAALIAATKLMP